MQYKKLLFILLICHVQLYGQKPSFEKAREDNLIKELFFAGLRDKVLENYASASQSFTKITAIDSKNDAAFYELAVLNYRQKKMQQAEANLKQAIAIKPDHIWYMKLLAEIYKQNGNMEALAQVFTQLIALEPTQEAYYFDRANALFLAGKTEQALSAYQDIEQRFGSSRELAIARERIEMESNEAPSAAAIEKVLSAEPTDIKNYLYLSGVLLQKNKTEEAMTLLQKAKNLMPDQYEIDLAMASIYQAQRKNELAIGPLKNAFAHPDMPLERKISIVSEMLSRFGNALVAKDATDLAQIALKINPDDTKLLILYGDVCYQRGNLEEAKRQYQAAIKQSSQLFAAWEKLLAIQTLMGQYAEAISTGEEAISIYPNHAVLYYYYAFALHRNGQNAAAGVEIKTALQLDGDDQELKAMIFALQAEVFIDQQKLREADEAFDQSIALSPKNYLTLSNYAYYLALRNHDLNRAESLVSKAAAALPKNASIADTYAFVLFKLEKYDLAKVWIEKAIQYSDAINAGFLEHYGDILFMQGEKDSAFTQWQKAKQAGNNSEKLSKKINEKKYIK